ncbi:MAG: hypothetical protein MUQ65_08045, partial [Armatimonadetes bacterium]|nr:hypothetical protein [Armatimonadota bacterium]
DDMYLIKTQDMAREFWSNGDVRRSYARHLGGVNFGFLDGHAAWWQADAVYANTDGGQNHIQDTEGDLEGMWCFCRHNLDWED